MGILHKGQTGLDKLRSEGLVGVAALVGQNVWRWWWRRRPTVVLDGCEFGLTGVPDKTRFLLAQGMYERHEREVLRNVIDPNLPVVELGGSLGVVACIVNKRLADNRRHIVVEANPTIIPLLEANRDRNRCQFTIIHRAIAYGSNQVTFRVDEVDSLASSLDNSAGRPVPVPASTLQSLLAELAIDRCTLICDIEDATEALIRNEQGVIAKHVQTLVVDTDSDIIGEAAARQRILNPLGAIGMRVISKSSQVYVLSNQ